MTRDKQPPEYVEELRHIHAAIIRLDTVISQGPPAHGWSVIDFEYKRGHPQLDKHGSTVIQQICTYHDRLIQIGSIHSYERFPGCGETRAEERPGHWSGEDIATAQEANEWTAKEGHPAPGKATIKNQGEEPPGWAGAGFSRPPDMKG